MRRLLMLALFMIALGAAPSARASDLILAPSLKYDALCLIGLLTGDPFYVGHYPEDYERFAALMTADEKWAFGALKTIIKDEKGGLVAPDLALYFSVVDAETLQALIATVEEPAAWKVALGSRGLRPGEGLSDDWTDADWAAFERVRPPLIVALRFLDRIGFDRIWDTEFRPAIDARIAEIEAQLGDFRILERQTQLLGFEPFEGPMTAFLVRFSKPHGIRITGPRYIAAFDYPLDIILNTAIHEPLHPPIDGDDPAVWQALAPLRSDTDFMARVEHHDPSFGYNSFEGMVDENCVKALDQILSEEIGIAMEAGERFRKSDSGMHILAAAIYVLLKQDGYAARGGNFQAWLTDPKTVARLAGHVRELAETVMGPIGPWPTD